MTGYGRGEASRDEVTVVVELRSVNNRFRDIQVRLPREYGALESRVAGRIRDGVSRGRIDAAVRRSSQRPATRPVADVALARAYRDAGDELVRALGTSGEVPLVFLLAQPGVLSVREDDVDTDREWGVVDAAATTALQALLTMRRQEGEALEVELQALLAEARRSLTALDAGTEGATARLRDRLQVRLGQLTSEVIDPSRLAQEVALLADRGDVTEELARLRSHCDQVAAAFADAQPVGRRLEFLLQEMHREVNTLSSKSAETATVQQVVDLKTVLERMREQVANVE